MSLVAAQEPPKSQPPETTQQHRLEKGWWPTKSDPDRKEYAGTEACAACHSEIVQSQQRTSMARTATKASDTQILRDNLTLVHADSTFQTVIARDHKGSSYTVSRGGEAKTGQLTWAMGDGVMGQTFILENAAVLYESQLTYFQAIRGLDLTPGHSPARPDDIEHAFGTLQTAELAQNCFACHTTASSVRHRFEPSKATPGITCEACHGPGVQHVNAMREGRVNDGLDAILNPARFDPVKLNDYCGACHRAPRDVTDAKDFVPINVRFQPYRLSKSRCFSRPDRRISCVGCHDPHRELETDPLAYDVKCLACHASRGDTRPTHAATSTDSIKQRACPVSSSHCVSCHMPRYKVPQMHGSFTDHDIRIVHPGDPFPL